MLDAILFNWFPNRLPEEFEDVDILRLFRMFEVQSILSVEEQRQAQMEGKMKGGDLSPDTWAKILEHDKLLGGP